MGKALFMRKGDVHTAPSGSGGMPPIGTPLNDMTWGQVRAISDAGLATSYFSVGDTKTIAINGYFGGSSFNLDVDVFILGIDHNSSREGANRIHFQIGKIGGKNICFTDTWLGYEIDTGTHFVMNNTAVNTGGWGSSRIRSAVLGNNGTPADPPFDTMLYALPSDLLAVMKSATKYTDNTGGGANTASYVTATTDYLWLLAEFEVFGTRSKANSAEQNYQKQYDYYKAGNSKLMYNYENTGTANNCWLRSPVATETTTFATVRNTGAVYTAIANYSNGLVSAFCV